MSIVAIVQLLAQESARKSKSGGWDVMLLMLVPIVIFFVWMSRSQKKRDQKRKDMLGTLKKGAKVVTIGGVHGEITRINEREVVLMVDKSKGIEIRFLRTAIASAAGSTAGGEGEADRLSEGGGGTS